MHAGLKLPFGWSVETGRVAPKLHCDHCRRELGDNVYDYWHMHFCSPVCVAAYKDRLGDDTKAKIRRLEATDFARARSKAS
jgi:hypothetical protein